MIWTVAGLWLWWIARDIRLQKFGESLHQARIWLFLLVNIASFFLWWLGDTVLFAVLFTLFHRKTRFSELLPATAAQYFLQAINILAADGALVVFLRRRKGVDWLTGTWTMMFQGLVDAIALSGVTTALALAAPRSSPIRLALPYVAAAFLFFVCVALWWGWGKPVTSFGRWMYNRPSAYAFRAAGLRHYLILGSIRLTMITIQSFLYYYSLVAFVPKMPLLPVLMLSPALQAMSNEPITPQGLGPLQTIFVDGLSRYAPQDKILTAAIGISVMALLCRLPLGLGAAGTFARRVLAEEMSEKERAQ